MYSLYLCFYTPYLAYRNFYNNCNVHLSRSSHFSSVLAWTRFIALRNCVPYMSLLTLPKKKKKKKYFPFDKYDIFCHIIFCLLKTVTFYTHYLFIYIYLWPWTKFGEKFFKLLIYIFLLSMNFENLTVEFHVSYVLNMYIKFRSNWILFTIWSTNLFFIYNFRLQKFEIITFIWWRSNWSLIFLKFCKH